MKGLDTGDFASSNEYMPWYLEFDLINDKVCFRDQNFQHCGERLIRKRFDQMNKKEPEKFISVQTPGSLR